MPTKPKRPCNYPGCPELISEGRFCEKHRKLYHKQIDSRRGTAKERGYDARWQRARRRYLAANPLCVKCLEEGRVVPSTTVDHIIPHRGDRELFWDESNWQALCKRCHDKKTAREDGGFGR